MTHFLFWLTGEHRMPCVSSLVMAKQEYVKWQTWTVTVTFDDLHQEATKCSHMMTLNKVWIT